MDVTFFSSSDWAAEAIDIRAEEIGSLIRRDVKYLISILSERR